MGLFSRNNNQSSRRASRTPVDETTVRARDAHGGVLRSELDEPDDLPEPFERVITATSVARHKFERGEITKTQLAETLRTCRVIEADGSEWTLGATSGRWYRRRHGENWAPAIPPSGGSNPSTTATPGRFDTLENQTGNVAVASDSDPFAALGDLLGGTYGGFDVAAHVVPAEDIEMWPEVTGTGSRQEPVAFAAPAADIDIFGVWDTSWESVERSTSSTPAGTTTGGLAAAHTAFGAAPAVRAVEERTVHETHETSGLAEDVSGSLWGGSSAFSTPAPTDIGKPAAGEVSGWAAWGLEEPDTP